MRIGKALGLRHEDLGIAERQVVVMPRVNDNRARVKAGRSRVIPTSAELMRLYADYLNREYGALDSDYVFVNLWADPIGHPLRYSAVYDLVGRLRRRTGISFGTHHFRHTYATWLQMSRIASGASFDNEIRKLLLPATSPFRLDQGRLAMPRHTHPDQAIDPAVALNVTMLQPIRWHPASDSCISCN
jgi:integrase